MYKGWLRAWNLAAVVLSGAFAVPADAVELRIASVLLQYDSSVEPIRFAAGEIRQVFEALGSTVAEGPLSESVAPNDPRVRVILARQDDEAVKDAGTALSAELQPQGYAISVTRNVYRILGADTAGVLYGGLDFAERVRLDAQLGRNLRVLHNPSIVRRGIKFNIPLDARTPSYDDTGDSAQNNYAEMWNFEFWREFLDDLARYRYNTLTLWNPHPFPSLVKLPNYPDAVLDDVCVTTLKPTYESGAWRDPQFVSPEVLKNLKVIKKMTIDEKIAFWRRVMQYAKDRCIDVYFITWNVIVNSAEGKYGITTAQDNPKTIAYLRECVRETILTYPLLTGIGITAGENMKDRDDEFAREKWIWNAYGLGILDAKNEEPDREVRFIHREWNSGLADIMKEVGAKYPDPFEIEFKYARAHLYSSSRPPFAKELVKEMDVYGVKCWWNLRNDDIFNFRWGDPEYVRAFLSNFPEGKTAGYCMGSDGYVWGREFTSLDPESPRQLEIDKHWFSFMLWGRLGYDLSLDSEYFQRVLATRFPEAGGLPLLDAWAEASKIIPLVNRFHWRDWDFMWAVEGCFDQRSGFHTVRDFISVSPMEDSGLVSIPDYVDAQLSGKQIEGTSPLQVAGDLQRFAAVTLEKTAHIRKQAPGMSKELRLTLDDLDAMAHLGNYYAAKILGATQLQFFERTKDAKYQDLALQRLVESRSHWEKYAAVAGKNYRPQLLARTRVLNWHKILEDVDKDIEIARSTSPFE